MEQLSLCTITTEACTLRLESCIHSQLEKSLCSKEDPAQPKIKLIIKKAQDHDNRELNQLWALIRRRQWHPTPVLLPGKSHGWRSLVGCSPWGLKELDTTERLHFHFSLSCIGEGNGNPLQCSCLETPRDRGAWWAAVSGVAQSQTRLK